MSEDYEQQANDFLAKTGTEFKVEFLEYRKYFPDDEEERDVYSVTLKRGERSYTFQFGQCTAESGFRLFLSSTGKELKYTWQKEVVKKARNDLNEFRKLASMAMAGGGSVGVLGGFDIKGPKAPTPYDVLASITKYDPGSFENFCGDYGYDSDSRKAEKTYQAVKKEFEELQKLYNDRELEMLAEIQ